jgi:cytochrome c551/c552
MQGRVFKTTIVTIAILTTVSLGSFSLASTRVANQLKMLTKTAGCMGCHQGETITSNKMTNVTHPKYHHTETKKNTDVKSD